MRRTPWMLAWLAMWLAAVLTFEYYDRIEAPALKRRVALHAAIVNGTAPYQYRFRILLPLAAEVGARLVQHLPVARLEPPIPGRQYSRTAFAWSYVALDFCGFALLLWCVSEFTREIYDSVPAAAVSMALAAVMTMLTFRNQYFHPWSLWEGAFFAAGLLVIYWRQYAWLALITCLALLNRETSVFLPVTFCLTVLPTPFEKRTLHAMLCSRDCRIAASLSGVWIAGWWLLHRLVGYCPATFFDASDGPATITLREVLRVNHQKFWYAVLLNVLVAGVALPLFVRGLQHAPRILRQAAWMLPAYFGLLLAIGYWWEIRYWMSAIPIVVPVIVGAVVPDSQPSGGPIGVARTLPLQTASRSER